MTATLISLISIFIGILGANTSGIIYKKYNFGLTGNTIAGVFGSIFLIKSIGRLGFRPNDIIIDGIMMTSPLIINIIVSFLGGFISLFIAKKIQLKLSNKTI